MPCISKIGHSLKSSGDFLGGLTLVLDPDWSDESTVFDAACFVSGLTVKKTKGGGKMVGTTDLSHIAGYLFIVGLIVAAIAGLAVGFSGIPSTSTTAAWISVAFVMIGLVIGFCLTTSKKIEEEIYVLVLVSLALLVASSMNVFGSFNTPTFPLGASINLIVGYVAMFSAAAIIVLAIRTLTRFHVSKIS